MEKQYISHLKLRGEKLNLKKIYNNYIIQKRCIYCDNYFKGNSKNFSKNFFNFLENKVINSNSIYGISHYPSEFHVAYKPLDLLDEVSKYGEKFYKLCKKIFKKLDMPSENVTNNLEKALALVDSNKLLQIFIMWCKNYGFPIKPEKVSLDDSDPFQNYIYELSFTQISELTLQFMIIYLINSYYNDLIYFIKSKNYEKMNESQYEHLENCMININQKNKLFGIICEELKFNKLDELDKKIFKNKCIEGIILILNLYSKKFNHPSEKYFSFIDGELYCQTLYTNVFDCCWDTIAENYKLFDIPERKCVKCGNDIPSTTNRKYCDKCRKNRNASQETHKGKKILIQEMIAIYNDNGIHNEKIEEKLKFYQKLINEKGHSKEIESLSKREELEPLYNKLKKCKY